MWMTCIRFSECPIHFSQHGIHVNRKPPDREVNQLVADSEITDYIEVSPEVSTVAKLSGQSVWSVTENRGRGY